MKVQPMDVLCADRVYGALHILGMIALNVKATVATDSFSEGSIMICLVHNTKYLASTTGRLFLRQAAAGTGNGKRKNAALELYRQDRYRHLDSICACVCVNVPSSRMGRNGKL